MMALVGLAVAVVLLTMGPTATLYAGERAEDGSWTYAEDQELACAAVLDGPAITPEERQRVHDRSHEGVVVEDGDRDDAAPYGLQDDWATATCDRLRQQRIGQAMLVGGPSTGLLAVAAAVLAVRRPQ